MNRFCFILLLSILFASTFVAGVLAIDQIDINTANLSQLDKLTGIGPAYAQRIIDGRPYSSIDDLDRVKGIGPSTIQKIKAQGFACVNCQTQLTQPTPTVPSPSPITISPSPELEEVRPPLTFDNVLITEIMPSPKGADETEEWIKLTNNNDFEVDLSGWQIKDTVGKTITYDITAKIPANGYILLTRPETKISLNNDKDGLELIKPDKTIADFVSYEKAPTGQSYIRTGNLWKWNNTLSNKSEATSIKTAENSIFTANQVSPWLSQGEKHADFKTWIIAILTAICSSAVILFLKIKLKGVDKDEYLS